MQEKHIERKRPCLWIVVPCYNEEEMLPLSMPRLEQLLTGMVAEGLVSGHSRIVYVDDCSADATWDVICRRHSENGQHCGLHLGRNSGQQNAIMAGLEASVGHADCTVTIDADLQDDVLAIREMVCRYLEGYEIVYGVRSDRSSDTFFKRSTAQCFYRLMNSLGAPTVYNHSEFRLMGSRAVRQLGRYRERTMFLRAIVPQLGFPGAVVRYKRQQREAGQSKWPFYKMLLFAVSGITSVSVKPIRLVFLFGLLFLAIALLVAGWTFYSMYKGYNVSGWSSLILSVWFVGGCVLTSLGVIGEYVGNIFLEVKQRPRYHITETTGGMTDEQAKENEE